MKKLRRWLFLGPPTMVKNYKMSNLKETGVTSASAGLFHSTTAT